LPQRPGRIGWREDRPAGDRRGPRVEETNAVNRRTAIAALILVALLAGCDGPAWDVQIADNPNSALSCLVSWTTDDVAAARVEFGLDGELQWFVEGAAEDVGTEHDVLVIGMKPGSTYTLQAVSIAADGEEIRSDLLTYETGAVPFDTLVTEVTAYDEAAVQPGWTLANVAVKGVNYPVTAAMFDMDGDPVWYWRQSDEDGRNDVEVSLVDGDGPAAQRLLVGAGVTPGMPAVEVDLAGEVVWEGPEQNGDAQLISVGAMHHSFVKLANGEYLALFYDGKDGDLWDVVEQFDADLNSTWSWSAESISTDTYPWGNAVLADLDADAAYYNGRMTSTLCKIDRGDGAILWQLGEGGDFSGDPAVAYPWFHEAHAPEIQPDGSVLLYDNGGASRDFSRVVEYALDEHAMTAEIAWEYPGELADDAWSTVAMGDADRLANGNTLVTAGTLIPGDSPSRVFEVTPQGDIAWELWFSGTDGDLAAPYMAERIPMLVGEL